MSAVRNFMATSKSLWSDDFGGKINNSVSRFMKECSC